jgi:Inovirus Gp2
MNDHDPHFDPESYEFNPSVYEGRTLHELVYRARRNQRELTKLINRLFVHHSRLLVVRIDLRYRKDAADVIPLEIVQMHRDKLLTDRRYHPEVFDGLEGYAWGLERGEQEGGLHLHLLAIFHGASRRDDIGIGLDIRDLWSEITEGYGECYISNFDKKKLAREGRLGIGMIHRDEAQLRINLIERVAAYITKKCSTFDVQSDRTESGAFRTFGRSWMPKPLDTSVPRRGRPPTRRI